MNLRERLRPPWPLLLLLLGCSLSSAGVLFWAGWNLIRQERAAEAHELRQQAEAAADRALALLRSELTHLEAQLAASLSRTPQAAEVPAGRLLLMLDGDRLSAYPPGRLLYGPVEASAPESPDAELAAAEALEFQAGRAEEAAAAYRRLASHPRPAKRAAALLRLGRVSNNLLRADEALQAYRELAALPGARAAGAPADLVAGSALARILAERGSQAEARAQAASLRRGLETGRWRLSRGQFAFYWSESARLLGQAAAPPPASAISEAAAEAAGQLRNSEEDRGSIHIRAGGAAFYVRWLRAGPRAAAILVEPPALLGEHAAAERLRFQLLDAEGRVVSGGQASGEPAAVRLAAQSGLPWSLSVSLAPRQSAHGAGRERFVGMVLAAAIGFIALATWLMARLIRREAAVARLQSDFVSGVSHEFRSPLTALRHLSEMLALGRVPEESRRQQYYETLAAETRRLQRLVETLLNFGRMEAGAQAYRFERVDAAAVAARVAAEFAPALQAEGRRIHLSGDAELWVDADAEAVAVALRNLIDNALKYSPGRPAVWVDCAGDGGQAVIRVRDEGLGIQPREQRLIFQRFVRGSSAGQAAATGTGVGLAMVRHIVHAHGGRIEVESEPGRGSTFTLRLPATRAL